MAQYPIESNSRPVNPVVQSLAFGLANEMFIAGNILPDVSTDGQNGGTIMGVGLETHFGNVDASYARAEGGSYHESYGPILTNTTFRTREYSDSVPVDRRTLTRTLYPDDLQAQHLGQIMNNLLIARELRVSNLLLTAANWTNSNTLAADFWDTAAGDPVGDMQTAYETVSGFGVRPNTIVIGRQARRTLQTAPALLEFLRTDGDRNRMTRGALRSWLAGQFEISEDRIFFGDSVRNTASPGQTVTLGDIWGDSMWFGHLNTQAVAFEGGVSMQPTAAARFVEDGWEMKQWDDENRNSIKMAAAIAEDELVIQAQIGYPIINVTQ